MVDHFNFNLNRARCISNVAGLVELAGFKLKHIYGPSAPMGMTWTPSARTKP